MRRYLICFCAFILCWTLSGAANAVPYNFIKNESVNPTPAMTENTNAIKAGQSKGPTGVANTTAIKKDVPVTSMPAAAEKKVKVIGNTDSKRYHLPGMKFYNAVEAYHRVEFESEADAIKAGYHKAPR